MAKPSHVPDIAVVDFDYLRPAGLDTGEVYDVLKKILHAGPDIRWTPYNGGHWIVTRFDDIRWVQENFQIFSHEVFTIPRGAVPIVMPPLTVDPPLHARYRAVLNPFFTPRKVAEMAVKARALTIELIERLKPKGCCEFKKDFAQIMPVTMFLNIVDLPLDRRPEFVEMAAQFDMSSEPEIRDAALKQIVVYLSAVLEERYKEPGDDLLSSIAKWRDNPRFVGEHEIIGMAVLIFFGGLDSVANVLSFVAWHLASHPQHRRQLIEQPEIMPRAVEEYLRRFGLSNTGRLIVSDVERKGMPMKAGEMIMVPIGLSSLDERQYPDPFIINFDREENFANGIPTLNTFGNGPHKCVGQPLARAELRIFLEEWLRLIPDFDLDPAQPPRSNTGVSNSVEHLHLRWAV